MIAQELEVSLHMAFVDARQKRHEFITVEHLLLALLDNPSAAETLPKHWHRPSPEAACNWYSCSPATPHGGRLSPHSPERSGRQTRHGWPTRTYT